MARKVVPKRIQTQILLKSKRRCALCFGLHNDTDIKEGQIAHIDRNNKNNNEENLAYLCLYHHNEYDSIKSQSKNLTEYELIEYKSKLERYMENSFIIGKKYCVNDYKLYDELKNNFIHTGIIAKFQSFYFGHVFYLEDFEISEGYHGIDLINFYDDCSTYIRFIDSELNNFFDDFKNSFYAAESMLAIYYQNYDNDNRMYYNRSYSEIEKCKHRQEFNMHVNKMLDAIHNIFNLVESTRIN